MLKDLKKIIQDYWTNNVPGLEKAKSQIEEINSDFFRKVDEYRVKNEPYVVPLIEYLSREKGKVLEVGCGLGADLRNFSRRGMQVVGVDLSLKNVELTKRGLEFCGLPVITTRFCIIGEEITRNKAGIIIDYKREGLEQAIFYLMSSDERLKEFRNNSFNLGENFISDKIFSNAVEKINLENILN